MIPFFRLDRNIQGWDSAFVCSYNESCNPFYVFKSMFLLAIYSYYTFLDLYRNLICNPAKLICLEMLESCLLGETGS